MINDDLIALRESARQVITGTGTPAYEETTWPLIVDLGWLLTSVPEELDGLGLGAQGACTLLFELGRGLAQAPFLPAMMAIDAVCHSQLPQKTDWLERLTSGECTTAPLVEPELTLDQPDTGETSVTGLASAIPSADKASHALVWTSDTDCAALVPLEQPGVEIIERPTWDISRRLFDLRFSKVALDKHLVLARGPAAQQLVGRLHTLRDFALAADSLGSAAAVLDLTVEHLQTRRQFGRPLALFQALKHRCADLKTRLAGAEAMLSDSLSRVGDRICDPEANTRAKKAKYLACSVFSQITEEALQLHGGIGMASEHPCHLFLKRAMLNQYLGTQGGDYAADIADRFLSDLP